MSLEYTEMGISKLPLEVLELIFSCLPLVTTNPFDSDFTDLASAMLAVRLGKVLVKVRSCGRKLNL